MKDEESGRVSEWANEWMEREGENEVEDIKWQGGMDERKKRGGRELERAEEQEEIKPVGYYLNFVLG